MWRPSARPRSAERVTIPGPSATCGLDSGGTGARSAGTPRIYRGLLPVLCFFRHVSRGDGRVSPEEFHKVSYLPEPQCFEAEEVLHGKCDNSSRRARILTVWRPSFTEYSAAAAPLRLALNTVVRRGGPVGRSVLKPEKAHCGQEPEPVISACSRTGGYNTPSVEWKFRAEVDSSWPPAP